MDFFYLKATETITILSSSDQPKEIQGVHVDAINSKITVFDKYLEHRDISTVKISVGDTISHINIAGIEERYEVISVKYIKRSLESSEFPDTIALTVNNLKNKQHSNGIQISNIQHSNIQIGNNNAINIDQIRHLVNSDDEVKASLIDLAEAIKSQDKSKLQTAIEFLLSKGFDMGLAIIVAKLTGQI